MATHRLQERAGFCRVLVSRAGFDTTELTSTTRVGRAAMAAATVSGASPPASTIAVPSAPPRPAPERERQIGTPPRPQARAPGLDQDGIRAAVRAASRSGNRARGTDRATAQTCIPLGAQAASRSPGWNGRCSCAPASPTPRDSQNLLADLVARTPRRRGTPGGLAAIVPGLGTVTSRGPPAENHAKIGRAGLRGHRRVGRAGQSADLGLNGHGACTA